MLPESLVSVTNTARDWDHVADTNKASSVIHLGGSMYNGGDSMILQKAV